VGCKSCRNIVIQTLERVCHVAVFINFPVILINILVKEFVCLFKKFFCFSDFGVLLAVENKSFRSFCMAFFYKDFFNKILHCLNSRVAAIFINYLKIAYNFGRNSSRSLNICSTHRLCSLKNSTHNSLRIELNQHIVSFPDKLH